MQIAHMADSHVGYRKRIPSERPGSTFRLRADDVRRTFNEAIGAAIAERVDLFVHAGDVFDRARPSLDDLILVVEASRRLTEAGIPQVWIAGNHDATRAPSPAEPFNALRRLIGTADVIFVPPGECWIGEIGADLTAVLAIGWGCPEEAIADADALARWDVIVAHGDVDVHGTLTMGDITVDLAAYSAEYVALGHLHVTPVLPPPYHYAGSTERFGWRDHAANPGWTLVTILADSAPRVWHVRVAARPMIDLGEFDLTAWDAAAGNPDAVWRALDDGRLTPGSLCRVLVTNAPRRAWNDIRRSLESAAAADWAYLHVDILEPGRDIRRSSVLAAPPPARLNVIELFDEFVGQMGQDPGFLRAFRKRGREALIAAAEIAAVDEEARS